MPPFKLPALTLVALLSVAACVPSSATPDALPSAPAEARWPVKVQPHVDLWMHGFGMITADTTPVPLFRRGYRDSMIVIKNRANAYTTLDANRQELGARLGTTPALLNAQFLVFSFPDWESLSQSIDLFLKAEGNPQKAADQQGASVIGFLAAQFPTAADRQWLRRFHDGLADERSSFYQNFWTNAQRERSSVLVAVTSLWEQQYRDKFARFLNSTQQRSGEMLVSLPLGPEGRAAGGREGQTLVAVPMPGRTADAREAVLVFAHEVVGTTAGSAVNDNTTPAEKRSGASSRYVAFAQVRGGAILLEKIAPELVEPYVRYYLAQGGHRIGTLNTTAQRNAALASAFPLPTAVLDGMTRQIDIALGGI